MSLLLDAGWTNRNWGLSKLSPEFRLEVSGGPLACGKVFVVVKCLNRGRDHAKNILSGKNYKLS